MYHIIVEQTLEYKNRMKFNPETNTFIDTGNQSLGYVRGFQHPYGWIKESGTPPKAHLDVILLTNKKVELGQQIEIKIVGCFVRNDGDNKLIAVLTERPETDFNSLPQTEKNDLHRLYPRVGEGEGWYGREKADEIIESYFKNKNIL